MLRKKSDHFGSRKDHPGDETMAAFVENSLNKKDREHIQKHLQECPECFENLACLRKSIKELEIIKFQPTPEELIAKAKELAIKPEGFSRKVYSWIIERLSEWSEKAVNIENAVSSLFRWKIAIPTFAVAAVAIMMILILQPSPPIKNYSMGNQLIISEMGLLGFVGEREVLEYSGMKVFLSEDEENIIFTWPAIAGAKFYHIDLIINEKRQRITPTLGIQDTSFSYPAQDIKLNTRYAWEILGKLEGCPEGTPIGGRNFQAKAGFVRRE